MDGESLAGDDRLTAIRFGMWSVLVDRTATTRAYARCSGSVSTCDCAPCRNFVAARDKAFPAPVLSLLAELGIDWHCEAEVYSQGRNDDGLHQYGGWFHFVGKLEAEIDNVDRVGEHFQLWFTRHTSVVPAAFGDSPVVQLEFVTDVPWVIDEAQPA